VFNLRFVQDIQGNHCLYGISRKGNLLLARTYQKDLELDVMCLDAMLRHIVLQCARVIGTFGAFLEDCPNNIGIDLWIL
jgi:hypothetical protein